MKTLDIYKCGLCGNIVEAVHVGGGQLFCCGQAMTFLEAGSVEASKEKHIPVIDKKDSTYIVSVGSVVHPMEEKHYIEWIELIADGVSYKKFLKPGQEPKASFCLDANKVTARAYCNLHGIWQKEG